MRPSAEPRGSAGTRGITAARVLLIAAIVFASCNRAEPSPASPSPGPAAPSNGSAVATGQVTDATSGAPLSGVLIAGDNVVSTTSSSTGDFTLVSSGAVGARSPLVFSSGSTVVRHTVMRVPGSPLLVSLIPSSFDLSSFDQMCRTTQLLRWRTAPPLIVETAVVQFTSVDAATAVALDERLTDAEVDSLVADLTWALPQLTGNQFQKFASVTRSDSPAGAVVKMRNDNAITVVRAADLRNGTGTSIGYGSYSYTFDGTVVSGAIQLDRDYERSATAFHRGLRGHELGHALGYSHVTSRTSVMNTTIVSNVIAEFDRQATSVAFQRPPGNTSPDDDPTTTATVNAVGPAVWTPFVP
jgi:hypothetical protein